MSAQDNTPPSIIQRLLTQPRRTAGMESHRQPVRLGEIRSDGHLVGYIEEHGLAWESLAECLVANHGARLAEALTSRSSPSRQLLRLRPLTQNSRAKPPRSGGPTQLRVRTPVLSWRWFPGLGSRTPASKTLKGCG